MNRVSKSIGWCDFTINPIKGLCKENCFYCYARRIYQRFKLDPTIRLDMSVFDKLPKKPSRIFVCSTHDIMGDWISEEWIWSIMERTKKTPQHIFLFLTKNPSRYDYFNIPLNCWLGVTATFKYGERCDILLRHLKSSNRRFISFEPLLAEISSSYYLDKIDWIIIGAMTGAGGKEHQPKREWIKDLAGNASENNIPVFMKSNLQKIWGEKLIQDFPDF